jgi:hypothetical protein
VHHVVRTSPAQTVDWSASIRLSVVQRRTSQRTFSGPSTGLRARQYYGKKTKKMLGAVPDVHHLPRTKANATRPSDCPDLVRLNCLMPPSVDLPASSMGSDVYMLEAKQTQTRSTARRTNQRCSAIVSNNIRAFLLVRFPCTSIPPFIERRKLAHALLIQTNVSASQ